MSEIKERDDEKTLSAMTSEITTITDEELQRVHSLFTKELKKRAAALRKKAISTIKDIADANGLLVEITFVEGFQYGSEAPKKITSPKKKKED